MALIKGGGGSHFGGRPGGAVWFEPDLSRFQAKLSRLSGTFQSGQVEMRAAFERMAEQVQVAQKEALQEAIEKHGRPQGDRPHESLLKVWGSPGNRQASADGFVVGIEEFLDASASAPYYRFIESGTEIFKGRILRGAFRTIEGTFVAPSRTQRDPRLIQLMTGQYKDGKNAVRAYQGKDAEGRVQRESQRAANQRRRREVKALMSPKGKLPGWRIVIHNAIVGYNFAEKGAEKWMQSGAAQREFERALADFKDFLEFKAKAGLTSAQARRRLRG